MSRDVAFVTDGASPVVICGMHRSGASLLTSLLRGAGFDMTTPPPSETPGTAGVEHDVPRFHSRVLRSHGLANEGFVWHEDLPIPATLRDEAVAAVDAQRRRPRPWGWSDPRTTLFLEFWRELVPDARFVFIVRHPAEVIDSLFRHGEETFALNPSSAARVWLHYNRQILRFTERHEACCQLVDHSQFFEQPAAVVAALGDRLGVSLAGQSAVSAERFLARRPAQRHVELLAASLPETLDVFAALRERIGRPGGAPVAADALLPARTAEHAMLEWSRSVVNARRVADLESRLTAAETRAAVAVREAAALRGQLQELQELHGELSRQVAGMLLPEAVRRSAPTRQAA